MTSVPNCDKILITEGLKQGCRLDGRGPKDLRDLYFEFAPDSSSCLLHLGNTRVLSIVNAEIGPPKQGRDNQGSINFKLGFDANLLPESPLLGNAKYQTVMCLRWLERLFFGGNALDREALCIVPGRMVWHLNVDVRIVDYDGNISDACVLSALGALAVHRRPQVTPEQVRGGHHVKIVTHSVLEREPLPLTLHHLPISISFAVFEGKGAFVVDPTLKETSAMSGCVSCAGDPQGNILNVQKIYGIPLAAAQISSCCRVAVEQIQKIAKILQDALKAHEAYRIKSRVVRSEDPSHLAGIRDTTSSHFHSSQRQIIQTEPPFQTSP